MKNLFSQNNLNLLKSVNLILLLSCMSLAVTEFLFLIPDYVYLSLGLEDNVSIFLYSMGFYLIYFLSLAVILDFIILLSGIFSSKIRLYYFIICLILLTLLNFIPLYILFSLIIIKFSNSILLIGTVSVVFSVGFSSLFSYVIVNSVDIFRENIIKHWRILTIIFSITAISLTCWGCINFKVFSIMLLYYLFVVTLLYIVFFIVLYLAGNLKIFKKFSPKIVIIPILVIISFTIFTFPSDGKLEAIIKKNNCLQNGIISTLAFLLDFDRDGYAPNMVVGGSDPDNFNPDKTPFSFDIPENKIDENNFGGDAINLKNGLNKPFVSKNFKLVFFFVANNLPLANVNEKNAPDIFGILKQSKTFLNIKSFSCNRLLTILSVLNSKFLNVDHYENNINDKFFKNSLFEKIKTKGYFLQAYLDIPYSSDSDIFSLKDNSDVFSANNNSYKNYISLPQIVSDIDSYKGRTQFVYIFIDGSNVSYFNSLFKGLNQYLIRNNLFDKSLFIFTFIPGTANEKDCKVFSVPFSFYYKDIALNLFKDNLSSNDVLPTILDLLSIKYDSNSYIGKSFVNYFNKTPLKGNGYVFIDPLYRQLTVIKDNYKLIYNIKEGYLEVYDINKDPKERNNIAYTNFINRDKLYKLVDFYLNNYSK